MINAEVTVKFIIQNTGDEVGIGFDTFDDLVRWLIREDGLIGLVELGHDDYEIMEIKKLEGCSYG